MQRVGVNVLCVGVGVHECVLCGVLCVGVDVLCVGVGVHECVLCGVLCVGVSIPLCRARPYHRMKLMLVGKAARGKTTLLMRISERGQRGIQENWGIKRSV